LTEYEALTTHGNDKPLVLELGSLEAFPLALIKARIAAKLSQKDLAERLGLKEQQIQRYEATEYASANLARVLEVSQVLGMKLQDRTGIEVASVLSRRRFSTSRRHVKTLAALLPRLGNDRPRPQR
jgi:transcriptional regulator with XRE-family HTH domain